MKFILGLLGVANPATWMIYAIKCAAILIALIAAYQLIDNNWATDAGIKKGKAIVQAEFDKFQAQVNANGLAAKGRADAAIAKGKQDKENADAKHAETVARLTADIGRLRNDADKARSARSILPAAAASSSRPDLACFDRAELGAALGELDRRLLAGSRILADEGTAATIDLNAAKGWARGR